MGPVNITLEKICIGRGLASIRVIKVSRIFLFYFFQKNQDKIIGGGGSVFDSINQNAIKQIKIPFPPLEVQKEIVTLMEKCTLLESQIKEKSKKQNEFSKSSMYFINQSKNKKERTYCWKILKSNFKDALYSMTGTKKFKAMTFHLCLNGKLDFQKLSGSRIKKSLQALIKEQQQHLKKEGIAFDEKPDNVWPMVELGKVCEILDKLRKPVTKSDRKAGIYPYYGATGILDYVDKYIFSEKLVLVGEDGAKWKSGDKTAFIAEGKYWVNNHAHVLKPDRKQLIDELLVYILNGMDLTSFITGVTVPKLNQKNLCSIKISLPPPEVQKEIVVLIEHIENVEKQINKEKTLRLKLSQSLSNFENYQKIM